jgi:uncharacterized membrane protein YeiB
VRIARGLALLGVAAANLQIWPVAQEPSGTSG